MPAVICWDPWWCKDNTIIHVFHYFTIAVFSLHKVKCLSNLIIMAKICLGVLNKKGDKGHLVLHLNEIQFVWKYNSSLPSGLRVHHKSRMPMFRTSALYQNHSSLLLEKTALINQTLFLHQQSLKLSCLLYHQYSNRSTCTVLYLHSSPRSDLRPGWGEWLAHLLWMLWEKNGKQRATHSAHSPWSEGKIQPVNHALFDGGAELLGPLCPVILPSLGTLNYPYDIQKYPSHHFWSLAPTKTRSTRIFKYIIFREIPSYTNFFQTGKKKRSLPF